jgi:hypothetical protein
MNIDFITDPEMAPRPREEIIIERFDVTPYPDGRRFRLDIEMTPFSPTDRPSLEIAAIHDSEGQIGSVSVIDTMHQVLRLIMHIKRPDIPSGIVSFVAQLYYDSADIQHQRVVQVQIPDDIPAAS